MMFTLLQEQHKAQLESMAAANKQAMDTMFERMNALIVGHSKVADKATAPITNSNTGCAPSIANHNKRDAQTAERISFTGQTPATSLRPMQASITQDGKCPRTPVRQSDRDWGRQIIV